MLKEGFEKIIEVIRENAAFKNARRDPEKRGSLLVPPSVAQRGGVLEKVAAAATLATLAWFTGVALTGAALFIFAAFMLYLVLTKVLGLDLEFEP